MQSPGPQIMAESEDEEEDAKDVGADLQAATPPSAQKWDAAHDIRPMPGSIATWMQPLLSSLTKIEPSDPNATPVVSYANWPSPPAIPTVHHT